MEPDEQCKRHENLQKYLLFLWRNSLPACVEVFLAPDCIHGERRSNQADPTVIPEPGYKLLERWTIKIMPSGRDDGTAVGAVAGSGGRPAGAVGAGTPGGSLGAQMNCKSLMQAVRSFLHFSQLTAWYSSSHGVAPKNVLYRVGIAVDVGDHHPHHHAHQYQRDAALGTASSSSSSSSSSLIFGHHDFDVPETVSEHIFPPALVGNKREVVQISVKTIPRTEKLPEVRCHFCGSGESAVTAEELAAHGGADDESLRVSLMKSRLAAAAGCPAGSYSPSPPPSLGYCEGAVGGPLPFTGAIMSSAPPPAGAVPSSSCAPSSTAPSSTSPIPDSMTSMGDGLLDPPPRLDKFARRYQSPSRSGSPCAEAPERLFFHPRRRTRDTCPKDLGHPHDWDAPWPTRHPSGCRFQPPTPSPATAPSSTATSGKYPPPSNSSGVGSSSARAKTTCQPSPVGSGSPFTLTPEEVREVMEVLRKPCDGGCGRQERTYVIGHCDTSSMGSAPGPTTTTSTVTTSCNSFNKPSEMLLSAILRTGRDKSRKPGRDTGADVVDKASAQQDGPSTEARECQKSRMDDEKIADGKPLGVEVGKPMCVDARVIKEKTLKYRCLSTSLPVGEDMYSLLGSSKGKVIQPSTSSPVTNSKSPLTRIASGIESSLSKCQIFQTSQASENGLSKSKMSLPIPILETLDSASILKSASKKTRRALKFVDDEACEGPRQDDDGDVGKGMENGDGHEISEELDKLAGVAAETRLTKRDVPSRTAQARFRRSFDSAACLVFHQRTGLPLTSSPAPCRRGGGSDFGFDSSLTSVHAIKSALFDADETENVPPSPDVDKIAKTPPETDYKTRLGKCMLRVQQNQLDSPPRPLSSSAPPASVISSNLLGSFEESVLNGRLEPVSTVEGFLAEIGASGSFCPKHLTVPVTVFFYTLCDNDQVSSPYLGHINLGRKGYRVPKQGTIQVTLFNPLQTVVKMFVVVYDLSNMPPNSQTFLRQRTLYMPVGESDRHADAQKWLRYLIHLRFASTKSGHVYLHTDIRMIVFRKSDVDAAMLHEKEGTAYELRSFTRGPENPQFSPRK